MKKVDVIFGGQFGSEAKRLFIEYYVNNFQPTAIVSNYGPNSGGFVSDGSKWSAFPYDAPVELLMLSPGSVIDPDAFYLEMSRLTMGQRVVVHQNAVIVSKDHIENEKARVTIGSTMTGTAAAVEQKMRRVPGFPITAKDLLPAELVVNNEQWFDLLARSRKILVSTPQGHSLSINFGFYPYCTSRNTSPQQGLADAGIPIQWVDKIIGCYRTFPIRVANRFDEDGNQIGYSGPTYPDSCEMSWDEVGVPAEYTSVSKKVRRVFSFSHQQYEESLLMNGVTDVFMSFINYLPVNEQRRFLRTLPQYPTWVGHGKTINDIEYAVDYDFSKSWV